MWRFFTVAIYGFKTLNLSPVEKVMLAVLAFIIVSSFLNTLYWPVSLWDSLVLYDFRAHIFAASGFMKEAFIDSYYINYPLLTSLGHTIVYLTGGESPQILHSLFYISLGAGFYGSLREFVSRKIALLSTLILNDCPAAFLSFFNILHKPSFCGLSFWVQFIFTFGTKRGKPDT